MRQATRQIEIATQGQGFYDVTNPIRSWVSSLTLRTERLTIWCQHTPPSLVVRKTRIPMFRRSCWMRLAALRLRMPVIVTQPKDPTNRL
jgi:thiamine phosphate synthase YjbQ (UPF0047 family)